MKDKIIITMLICMMLVSVLPVSIAKADVRHITGSRLSFLEIQITSDDLDKTKTIQLAYNKRFNNIRIVDGKQTSRPAISPSLTFTKIGDDFNGTNEFAYTQPYYCNVVDKMDGQKIDIFVPSKYYDENKEIQIENMTLELTIETQIDTLPPMYIPQDEQIEYLIITTSALWDTFNNNFKQWKISTDNKINTIEILNVSDIINTSEYWVNGTWGDGTNSSQGNQWVDPGRELKNNFSMFNDTQCKIRNCIRQYVAMHGTSWILLAGNKDFVPPRIVFTPSHSGPDGTWYNWTSATDMYYGSLYCNWNNNTNDKWGEDRLDFDWAKTTVWDDINYGFDVTVGRALIDSVSTANLWINKIKEYVDGNAHSKGNYLQWHVLAAKDVGSNIDDYVWTQIGDEFPANMTFINGQNISQKQWSNLSNYGNGLMPDVDGMNIIYHSGHGGTLYNPYSAANLYNNKTANFVYTEGCQEADFGSATNTDMERWQKDDGCLFAGIGNTAYGWFIASTWYGENMMMRMFNDTYGENELEFARANDESREAIGTLSHSVCPMIFKELNYFGDPAMEYQWYQPTSYYNITGTIYYNYSDTSPIIVGIFDEMPDENSTPIDQLTLTLPGQYSFEVTNGTYYIDAFMDLNENEYPDPMEPMGIAINKTWNMTPDSIIVNGADISNANVILYFTQYYTISGTIYYNGTNNGMIYIEAFDEPFENNTAPVSHTSIINAGAYSMYVENGTFYVLSFLDKDNDQQFDSWYDPLGVAINKTSMELDNGTAINVTGNNVSNVDIVIYDWPINNIYPTIAARHVGIYDRCINILVIDQNGSNMNVSLFWENGTRMATFNDVTNGSNINVSLQDYFGTWLPHDTLFRWYVILNENESNSITSDIFNFTTSKAWDLNEDGRVNAFDISGLLFEFAQTCIPGSIGADIDENGHINAFDVSILLVHYGENK